jgi:hypothetical protein
VCEFRQLFVDELNTDEYLLIVSSYGPRVESLRQRQGVQGCRDKGGMLMAFKYIYIYIYIYCFFSIIWTKLPVPTRFENAVFFVHVWYLGLRMQICVVVNADKIFYQ